MNKTVALFVVFILIAGISWVFVSNPALITDANIVEHSLKDRTVLIHHTLPVAVDVADTEALRIQGLSGRTSLADNHGLFMVFDADDLYGIWMKDMHFSIDIIWADAEGKIVTVYENATPQTYPKIFYPNSPARFVLEVPGGYVEAHNIVVGDTLELK